MGKHSKESKEWKDFKRNRHGDEHINNCKTGYCAKKHCQIHHVLCVHACSDVNIEKDSKDYIHKCMALTTWNINAEPNNIGLPLKTAYVHRIKDAVLPGKDGAPAGWDGLPCHQTDHHLYLKEVEVWVKENIWDKLKADKKDEKCEPVTGKNIADLFEAGSTKWRAELKARGIREGGTKAVIDKEFALENWYFPFSMAAVPSKRMPPSKTKKLSLAGFLKKIK